MDWLMDHLFLSRLQFAMTTMFHITWPLLSIGLSIFMLFTEAMWLRSGEVGYYHQTRFWSKLFLLNFAIGVVSGIPLEFQFGTNWSAFSQAAGPFFGQILGFEATMAFMLEAAFLYIMLYGWNRVSPAMHLFSTGMVALGASLSAFWIMVANSWMQTPSGGRLENGSFKVTDMAAAIFNPDLPWGFSHMWVACLETTIFVVGGLSAWYLLRRRHTEFFTRSFKIALVAAVLVTPLQALLGDSSGRAVAKYQPTKLAATESHWNTNAPGTGASWSIIAWPDRENARNSIDIRIPYGLSLLITRTPTGVVKGLKEFPREDWPPIVLPFYAFRIMVGIGFAMIGLMGWGLWAWRKGRLTPEAISSQRRLLWGWLAFLPLGYLAVAMGWVTREVGRQPWIAYGLIRTGDGASSLPPQAVHISLLAYLALYSVLTALFAWFAWRIIKKGPDTELPPPARARSGRGGGS